MWFRCVFLFSRDCVVLLFSHLSFLVSNLQNHTKQTIQTQNLRLRQSTELQQKRQLYPVTPEDGQLA
jgi:hypothetical protein